MCVCVFTTTDYCHPNYTQRLSLTTPAITRRVPPVPAPLRGWWNTVGNLVGISWLEKAYHGPRFTDICVNQRGVRFHRIRDSEQHCFNSFPATSRLRLRSPGGPHPRLHLTSLSHSVYHRPPEGVR